MVLNVRLNYGLWSQTQADSTGHVFTDVFTPCPCLLCVHFIVITEFYIKKDKQMDWTGLMMVIWPRVCVSVPILIELLMKNTHKLDSVCFDISEWISLTRSKQSPGSISSSNISNVM